MREVRRWAAAGAVAVLVGLAGMTGCGSEDGQAAPTTSSGPTLPDGWRWESFGDVEVGVPGDWGWGNSSQRFTQWCVEGQDDARLQPIIGRPGLATAVGCPTRRGGPDPSTLVAHTGQIAGFDWVVDRRSEPTAEGDQGVRRIGRIEMRVNAPTELRKQILATAHRIEIDANGCATHLPAHFRPGAAPIDGRDVTTLAGVTSVSACRYSIAGGDKDRPQLLSSLRLDGDQAAAAVRAIADAPLGGGPDRPSLCLPKWSYGDEMILARIRSDSGQTSVNVYYSGCEHNGFDDGSAVRALTREAMQPLIAAGNTPEMWIGPGAMTRILRPAR